MKFIAVFTIVSLLLSSIGFAQDKPAPAPGWGALRPVSVGQKLQVNTRQGKSMTGILQRITDSGLELDVSGKSINVPSADVQRIYVLRGRPLARRLLIGAAIGTGGGAAFGAIAGKDDSWFGQGVFTAAGAALGFAIGSLTGLAFGLRQSKMLVYDATVTH